MTADTYTCPICAKPVNEGDLCLRDIDEGDCHAPCLEGAPFVDLDTGDLLPDGALALADRVLPEAAHWEICTPNSINFIGPYAATISDPKWLDVSRDDWESFTHGEASGNTPALALVIAILRAKQGEGE